MDSYDDYDNYNSIKKSNSNVLLIIFIVLIIVSLIGVFIYFKFFNNSTDKNKESQNLPRPSPIQVAGVPVPRAQPTGVGLFGVASKKYSMGTGRPLVINNEQKVGNIILVDKSDWVNYPLSNKIKEELSNTTLSEKQDFIKHWLKSGTLEHASIPSFAQVILELTSFGAPEELISGATRAMNDEIKHTKIALSLAQLFNKTKQFSISLIKLQPQLRNINEFIKDNYRDAIINESKAAQELFKLSLKEKENNRTELSNLIKEIGIDETRHAQLGVDIDNWAKTLF